MAELEKPNPKQQQSGPDTQCPPDGTEHGCDPLPQGPKPPDVPDPKKCDPKCNCPGTGTPPPPCFDKLIADQAALAASGVRASQTQADLEKMLSDAKAAKQTYTREKYDDFLKRWLDQDKAIIGAIDIVTCNIPCWWCVIECQVCQLLYRIRWLEQYLDGSPDQLITQANTLRDLQYWHQRNVAAKQSRFDRIDAVLKAWNDPATSIDNALKADQQIIDAVRSMDPIDALVKVFFELIPRHLAIAPKGVTDSAGAEIKSNIKDKYIKVCVDCDDATPDDCCGPDVALPSARQRLIDPQAFIVDPDKLFDILCCIATERYEPAKQQLEDAQAALAKTTAQITTLEAELDTRRKDPLADYRGSVGAKIDCEKYKKKNGDGSDDCGCDDDERSDGESAS